MKTLVLIVETLIKRSGLWRMRNCIFNQRFYHNSQPSISINETHMIDLRSDTTTLPSPKMRQAMAEAKVGDDVFGEDPTVNTFQKQIAELFGMEAALFVPSGTMGNFVSVLSHCHERGLEILLGDKSHIHLFEQGGISTLGGVHPRTLVNFPDGTFDLDSLDMYVRPRTDPHQPFTQLICVENTHNICGGKVIPLDFIKRLHQQADKLSLKVHMDGARLMNAAVAQNISVSEYLQYVDSVSFCLSKGIGAPIGSIIGGKTDFIARCLRLRKVVGGGMRQTGILAAAAMVAMEDATSRIKQDHIHAKMLSHAIVENGKGVVNIDLDGVHTNIVLVNIVKEGLTADMFCKRLNQITEKESFELNEKIQVQMLAFAQNMARFVTHSNLSGQDIVKAQVKFEYILQELQKTSY